MDYLGKGEVLTNTDLDKFVNDIQLMKNGGKNKCCVYNFGQCI